MLHNDGEVTKRVDDSAALSRRGLLIETVAASIADITERRFGDRGAAAGPDRSREVVRIDRLVMVEIKSGTQRIVPALAVLLLECRGRGIDRADG
jgi:hypothetical protein